MYASNKTYFTVAVNVRQKSLVTSLLLPKIEIQNNFVKIKIHEKLKNSKLSVI